MAALQLPATTSLEEAPALLREIEELLVAVAQRALQAVHLGGLTIDASALSHFDTSAIALLLHAQRGANARGIALQVQAVPAKLRELAGLYGVGELLPQGSLPAPTPASATV